MSQSTTSARGVPPLSPFNRRIMWLHVAAVSFSHHLAPLVLWLYWMSATLGRLCTLLSSSERRMSSAIEEDTAAADAAFPTSFSSSASPSLWSQVAPFDSEDAGLPFCCLHL